MQHVETPSSMSSFLLGERIAFYPLFH